MGKVLEISGSLAESVGKKNPFRYRGYYYDSETEMYYLQSRYYDPEVKRFINADETDSLEKQEDLYDKNLYAYCDNNPVMRVDSGGAVWHLIIGAVVGIATQFIADVGIGFTNAVVANAALGGGTYLANCSYKGEEATTGDLVVSAAIGGIAGAIGGSGANGKNMRGIYSRSKQVIATTKSARKTAMYAAKIEAVKKNIVKSGVKTFVAGIYSNTHNSFRKNITRSILWLNFTALLIIYGAEILVVLLLIFLNYRGRHGKGFKNSR